MTPSTWRPIISSKISRSWSRFREELQRMMLYPRALACRSMWWASSAIKGLLMPVRMSPRSLVDFITMDRATVLAV